jgi:hypothetical protein
VQHEDLLIGIAEISIALTGFAGVVVVLGRRSSGPWPLAEQYHFRSLIENGLLAVLAALLPFAVLQHTSDPSTVWRVSSGIFGAASLAHAVVIQGRRQRRLRTTEGTAGLLPTPWMIVIGLGSIAVHIALFLNAAGLFFEGTFGPYLYGLLWDLSMGSLFFIRLVRFD